MSAQTGTAKDFLEALDRALVARIDPSHPAAPVTARILAALRQPAEAEGDGQPQDLPVCRNLSTAISNATEQHEDVVAVALALRDLAPRLAWRRRPDAADAGQDFFDGHATATIVGPEGLECRQDVMVGVSLVAPQVRYPDHRHPPEEVYLVLSPGDWRQADGPWHRPGPGGIVHNPPGITHAMRAEAAPLLAVWLLWLAV